MCFRARLIRRCKCTCVIIFLCAVSVLVTYYASFLGDYDDSLRNLILNADPRIAKKSNLKIDGEMAQTITDPVVNAPVHAQVGKQMPPIRPTQDKHLEQTKLMQQPDQKKRYKMVVGIITALRNPPTVLMLAERLVSDNNISDYKLLVLQSCSAAGEVETKFSLERLGYTVFTMSSKYAELQPSRLKITWNDPVQRVIWRTNHGKHICVMYATSLMGGGGGGGGLLQHPKLHVLWLYGPASHSI